MSISEETRHEMYSKLEEVLGAQIANTLMEHLPPVGWADVATKRDLETQVALVRGDLETQVALVRGDLETQIALVRGDLDAGLARVISEVADRLRAQTLVLCTTLIAGMGVVAALARV